MGYAALTPLNMSVRTDSESEALNNSMRGARCDEANSGDNNLQIPHDTSCFKTEGTLW